MSAWFGLHRREVLQVQRPGDLLLDDFVVLAPVRLLEDRPQKVVGGIGVRHAFARRKGDALALDLRQDRRRRQRVHDPDRAILDGEIAQPAYMRQHLPEGDLAGGRHLRMEVGQRVVQAQPSLLDQSEGEHGGHHLGDRGDLVAGVLVRRHPGQLLLPEAAVVDLAPIAEDRETAQPTVALLDLIEVVVQHGRMHPGRCRLRRARH